MSRKKCSKCKKNRNSSSFSKMESSKDGLQGYCKGCASKVDKKRPKRVWAPIPTNRVKKYHLASTYAMSEESYDFMLRHQGFVCAICSKEETRRTSSTRKEIRGLSVDHCHETGKIRGLLCDKCNNGIARFDDNPELLTRAADYLENYSKFYGNVG